jgi:hypothetical protein
MIPLLLACADPVVVEPVGPVEPAPLAYGRDRKRMDIDQVAASIEAVTGQRWTEQDTSGETQALFDALSGTLGKPDYLSATEEDLAPGLLFQKFLDDAARSTCTAAVEADLGSGTNHILLVDDREDNMAELMLRFHGHQIEPNDERLQPWLDLHAAAVTSDRGWALVCVGLITHPDFYTY